MSSPVATTARTRRGMWRWSVAVVATAALVVSGSGLVVFAQSGDGQSQGPQFAPADAIAYVEARLDMPAGQDEAVAQMMTAFPGFADVGSFDMKMDELISGLGAQMGMAMPEGDLIGDVLTGEIGVAVGGLEAAMMGGEPSVVVGLAAADAEAARAMMEALVTQAAGGATESSYNEVVIYSDPAGDPPTSLAMHGDWLMMGIGEGAIESAIDALDGTVPSLADDADFAAAWSRLPSARLGAAWMDLSVYGSLLEMGMMMAEGEVGMGLPMSVEDIAAMMPAEMVASLVAEDDRLTLEMLMTPGEMTPATPVGESELAMSFPADTQVYIETRELGAAVEAGLTQLADMMAAQAEAMPDDGAMGGMSDIDAILGEDSPWATQLGAPIPEFLDFVGDAGVGAGLSSDGLWLGIAGEVVDGPAAVERMDNLMQMLGMFTMMMEDEGISIETADVAGVEVTSIILPMDDMMAEGGVPLSLGDSIDVALTDDTLLIGLGDFVEAAILSDGTDSLGSTEGYVDALGDDTVNSGVMYVDIGSLVEFLDPMLSMMAPEWAEIAPYAAGFDRMIAVGTADDEVMRSRMTVIVGQ